MRLNAPDTKDESHTKENVQLFLKTRLEICVRLEDWAKWVTSWLFVCGGVCALYSKRWLLLTRCTHYVGFSLTLLPAFSNCWINMQDIPHLEVLILIWENRLSPRFPSSQMSQMQQLLSFCWWVLTKWHIRSNTFKHLVRCINTSCLYKHRRAHLHPQPHTHTHTSLGEELV